MLIKTFKAQVAEQFIEKSNRLFSCSTPTILSELLQNARRAGANTITVSLLPEDGGTRVTIEDNGGGIKDLATLLNLGQSSWEIGKVQTEEPAGMGFFSLAHLDSTVVQSCGQTAVFNAACFIGKEEVLIENCEQQETRIAFSVKENIEEVTRLVKAAACYMPVKVMLNDQAISQQDFLADCKVMISAEGLRIGVTAHHYHDKYNINFLGHLLCDKLPNTSINVYKGWLINKQEAYYATLYCRVDVTSAHSVTLKLPDRTELVHNDKLEKLNRLCRQALYQRMAELVAEGQHYHVLSATEMREAESLGVKMPPPEPLYLAYSTTSSVDNGEDFYLAKFSPPLHSPEDGMLVAFPNEGEWRDLFRNLLFGLRTHSSGILPVSLGKTSPLLHDKIWRLDGVEIKADGKTVWTMGGWSKSNDDIVFDPAGFIYQQKQAPKQITASLKLSLPAEQKFQTVIVPLQALLVETCGEGIAGYLAVGNLPDADTFYDMLEVFSFIWDPNYSTDYDTTRDSFETWANDLVVTALKGEEALREQKIRQTVRSLQEWCGKRDIRISTKRGKTMVQLFKGKKITKELSL